MVNLGARAKHTDTDDTTEPMDNWDQIITQRASQQTLAAFLAPLDLGTDRIAKTAPWNRQSDAIRLGSRRGALFASASVDGRDVRLEQCGLSECAE